jgi:competence protein ComGC
MKVFLMKICRNKKRFTLVELLIVFTLLGVLAAIMIPNGNPLFPTNLRYATTTGNCSCNATGY